VSTVNTAASRFREARELLNLTQQGLADRLLLSRNYIAQIEMGVRDPSLRVLSGLESLLAKVDPARRPPARLKSGGKGGAVVREAQDRYETVASRFTQPRTPATRKDCEAYVQGLLDLAAASNDPNAWPVILHRLKKEFPLDEWPADPEGENKP